MSTVMLLFCSKLIPIILPLKVESIYHTILACYIMNPNESLHKALVNISAIWTLV